jgi:TorA maturation chaperone TorD
LLSLEERAPIYAWLSPLFAKEIDADAWQELRTPAVHDLFARLDPEFEAWIAQPYSEALGEDCAAEFARLFLLPGGAPPFASAWMDGNREQLGTKLSTIVLRSCEVLGRTPRRAEPWGKLALDHVGLLFDLVSGAALSADELDLETGRHLAEQTLGEWLVPFGAALREKAQQPVYRALGRCLETLHAVG